ncbi:hypothetical protein K466DRAFT_51234 [Polyporus arcularius HHB13444]|uniref:Secreted protein n=1 Tax=Polyporus arcularius HHB13444 TaxID=1314778 RepID=A0A5C3PI37_9APHY|nr:hypothetical protein K466DRAFT_51234 [Polyporus arcularius HHB13444]
MWRSIRFCAGYVVFVHFHHTAAIGQPDTPESDLLNPSASEQSRDQHNHATSLMGIGRTRSPARIIRFPYESSDTSRRFPPFVESLPGGRRTRCSRFESWVGRPPGEPYMFASKAA